MKSVCECSDLKKADFFLCIFVSEGLECPSDPDFLIIVKSMSPLYLNSALVSKLIFYLSKVENANLVQFARLFSLQANH